MPASSYKFAEFELDSARFELRRNGEVVKLERIPMELLVLLVASDGNVVSRQDIVERLWGKDVYLDTEHGINTAIRKIRQALKDDPERPRFVQTVTGKGYRFIASLSRGRNGVAPVTMDVPVITSQRVSRFWLLVILIAALAGALVWHSLLHKPRALTEKDSIVLAEFTNTTGDAAFDGALQQALSADLAQSPFLSVLSEEQVQQTLLLMGQKPDATLTPNIAQEVCQRTSSAAFLEGSIAQIGAQYLLVFTLAAWFRHSPRYCMSSSWIRTLLELMPNWQTLTAMWEKQNWHRNMLRRLSTVEAMLVSESGCQ